MIKTAYYSYWSGGIRKTPSKFLIASQIISLYYAKQHFKKIHLITDSVSKSFFEDMGFDSITTELDNLDNAYEYVWSLGKLLAYKIASERGHPFLHIDYDVYLWKNFNTKHLDSPLIAQYPEDNRFDIYDIPRVVKECPNLHLLKKIQPNQAINVGIFGGNDLNFIKNYASGALKFVLDPKNKNFWISKDTMDNNKISWQKACIAEQYYLEVCRIFYKKKINFIFPKETLEEDFATQKGFTHLLLAKNNPSIISKVTSFAEAIKNKEKRLASSSPNNETEGIENIVKIFGLPKSGTNIVQLLCNINLQNYVCQIGSDHPNSHYMGWKHGIPKIMPLYDMIEQVTKQKLFFVFTIRDFESWKNSILTKHQGSYEFPHWFSGIKEGVIYNTPYGPEHYKDLRDLYDTYNNEYISFAAKNESRCLLVNFKDLKENQTKIVEKICNKFNFKLTNSFVCEIKKQVASGGNLYPPLSSPPPLPPPPDCVPSPYDPSDPCYVSVINNDPYCCEVEWDRLCQDVYDICASG